MKIIPLIAAAEARAQKAAEDDVKALIAAIDEQINELEQQLDAKLAEIVARLTKLEQHAEGKPD
jgi:uncharacterized protein YceH (UPF0502 family)